MDSQEELYYDARWDRALSPGDMLGGLVPMVPFIHSEEPAIIQQLFSYEALREYRLMSAPVIVRYHYDLVSFYLEEGVRRMRNRQYLDWLMWVEDNL